MMYISFEIHLGKNNKDFVDLRHTFSALSEDHMHMCTMMCLETTFNQVLDL